jgi:hypothetical protein
MDFSLIEKNLRPQYYKSQTTKTLNIVGLSPQAYFQIIPHIDVKKHKIIKFIFNFFENFSP